MEDEGEDEDNEELEGAASRKAATKHGPCESELND